MSEYKVRIMPDDITVSVPEGTNLLEAQIKAGLHPYAPCGGRGTCNKCIVNVTEGSNPGVKKACLTKVTEDMTIVVPRVDDQEILQKGAARSFTVAPIIKSLNVSVRRCQLGEKDSDWLRLKEAVCEQTGYKLWDINPNMRLISHLSEILNENDFVVNVVVGRHEILDIRKADDPIYLAAFDIGTTTCVGYLLDGKTGKQLQIASMLNPQSQYGGDVIERSNYAISGGIKLLSDLIHQAMNQMIETMCVKQGITKEQIYLVSMAGNTCMHHLFTEISPKPLVIAPYNPAISEGMIMPAENLDIHIARDGLLMVLPNIAGFVGADTSAVLLATEFDEREELTLMIDIGTNGEMVLGDKDRRVACSTAAGPAFEGAKIECGMRGATGAIDHAKVVDGKLEYTVIGKGKPVGFCGSGLMDLITIMLEQGLIDEMGAIQDPEDFETEFAKSQADRIIRIQSGDIPMKAWLVADENESGNGQKIYMGQKDIREIQLAKSAMAAGIELMADTLGVELSDIRKVLIAGAFGNYMDPHSACGIGMIPMELEDRIEGVGNAAGEGAKIAALNFEEFLRSGRIAAKTQFVELATHPDFQDCFVDNMEFPEV